MLIHRKQAESGGYSLSACEDVVCGSVFPVINDGCVEYEIMIITLSRVLYDMTNPCSREYRCAQS